jgi:peptide/nickel transport system permease protein
MAGYIFNRILATIPVMAVVALIVFFLLRLSTGDPAAIMAGDAASPAQIEQMRHQMGLDRPIAMQFFVWLNQLLSGDFGLSLHSKVPVWDMIAGRVGPSLALSFSTIAFSILVAIPLGVVAAWAHGTLLDRAVMSFSVIGFSAPIFVTGYILVFCFALKLDWLPVQGYHPPSDGLGLFLQGLILPTLALSTIYIALISRITRSSLLEIMGEDFIRTARAKGASEFSVFLRHALRNASIPIVTIIGVGAAFLISGVVVTESVFNIPGLGRMVVEAVLARDYPLIQGLVLVFSFVYVTINLIVDLLYTIFDPRITY